MSASIVGSSSWMNDVNVEAPIMSPAAANTVFGFVGAQLVHRGRERGDAARRSPGCFDAAVEVVHVTRLILHVDRRCLRGGRDERARAEGEYCRGGGDGEPPASGRSGRGRGVTAC